MSRPENRGRSAGRDRARPASKPFGGYPWAAVVLLLFLLAPGPLSAQNCHDPINGCSPSEQPSDDDSDTSGGGGANDSCASCPEVAAQYAEVLALYYGGEVPGPALTLATDSTLVDSDSRLVQRLLVTLGSGEYLAKAQELTGGAADGYAEVSATAVELADRLARTAMTTNSSVAGDPNILASGTLTHTETDLTMDAGEVACAVERTYRSDRSQWSSFGPGWSGTGDARIVLGTTSNLAPVCAALHAARLELESLVERSDADVAGALSLLRDHRDRVVAPSRALAAQAEARASAVYDYAAQAASGRTGAELLAECAELRSLTQATADRYSRLAASLSEGIATLAELAPGSRNRDAVTELAASFSQLERRAEEEQRRSLANEAKNRQAFHPEDPPEYSRCGVDSVTLVDGRGVPHLYRYDSQPASEEAAATYTEGIRSYYPGGVRLTPANPLEPSLSLDPDGRWLLVRDDGGDRYGFFGLIESTSDRNGNTVRFERSGEGVIEGLVDGRGRRIGIETFRGRIVSAVDPLGRTVRYAYGLDGRLSSVTDAARCAVRYHYTGALLTAIEKPDDSHICYDYAEHNGRSVLVATTDEEGHSEQFDYGDGWTVHTDRAGVSTTYRFDKQMREVAVEHADGSRRTTGYDEQGRVILTTDEIGATTRYERDARGNVVRTTFADGTTRRARYDASDRLIEETDERDGKTAYAYDVRGNLLSVVHPDGTRRAFSYDAYGSRLSVTDELGGITLSTYDRSGGLESQRAPDGGVVRYEHDAVGNLTSVTDELGCRTRFEYSDDSRPTAVVDPLGRRELYRYDSRRDLVERIDRLGGSTRYEYDRRHLCVRIVDPAGIARSFRYRADGRIEALTVDGRDPIRYEYDERGRLASFGQSDRRRRFERDPVGHVVAVTDPNGNTVRLERDVRGRLVSLLDPLGNARRFTYDASGNLVSVRDATGAVTDFTFDARNRLVARHNALGGWRHYTYDPAGNLASVTDERGATASYLYDPCNRLTTVTDACGAARRFTYTSCGRLGSSTGPTGSTWSYDYDPNGLLTAVTDPIGGRRSIIRDLAGRPVSTVDPNGNTTRFEYDGAGRLTARIDPYGAATRYSYRSLESIESVTGRRGEVWRYVYDPAGLLVSLRDPLGKTETYRYDGNGNLIATGDPAGTVTRYEYDALDRLQRRIDPTGAVMEWGYDPEGRLLSETDALGRVYRFRYDALGRLVGETARSGQDRQYTYDRAGNPVSERDFNGNETRYRYDPVGRLIAVDGPDESSSFSYDPEGKLVEASNPARAYRFAYDALSRLVSESDDLYQWRRDYRYDANGNCTELRDGSTGTVDLLRYGKNDELLAVTDARRAQTLFEHDAEGNLVAIRRPNGVVERRTYDLAGRPTSNVVAAARQGTTGPPLWGQVYLYDAVGRRSIVFDSADGATAYRYDAAGRLVGVSLPPQNPICTAVARATARLTGPTRLAGAATDAAASSASVERIQRVSSEYLEITPQQASALQALLRTAMPLSRALFRPRSPVVRVAFTYDPVGNRVSQSNPWGEIEYRYGADHEVLSAGRRRFSYDPNGNLLRETFGEEEIEYRYSAANRLTTVTFANPPPVHGTDGALASAAPASIEYAYDPLGRRTRRRTHWVPLAPDAPARTPRGTRPVPDRPTALTEETYDYDRLSFRLVRSTGRTLETGDATKDPFAAARGGRYRYLRPETAGRTGPPAEAVSLLYAADRLLATRSGDSTVYHSTDALGSIVASTDPRGVALAVTRYSPFGASSGDAVGSHLRPGFTGKNLDPLTGLYDFGMRDYSPLMGRWTTPDPIKSGTNWYLYAHNDPVNFTDPTGLLIEPVSLTYYQDRNPRVLEPESYANAILGAAPSTDSDLRSSNAETISEAGCLLTAAVRIANSLNHDESSTPGTANVIAVKKGFYVSSSSGELNELTPRSTAALISELTSMPIAQERYYGTQNELDAKLTGLNQETVEHYVVGHLVVGEGDSAYSHYLNVQAINGDGTIEVADTSVTNREYLTWNGERMVDIMVFTSKAK